MRAKSISQFEKKAIREGDSLTVRNGDRRNFVMVPNTIVRGGHKPQFLAVLFAIASHAGEGECYASAATIAEESGTSLKMVSAALKYWEGLGQIRTENRKQSGQTTVVATTFDFVGGYGQNDVPGYGQNVVPPTSKKGEGYDEIDVPGTTKSTYKEEPLKKTPKEDTTLGGGEGSSPSSEENKQVAEVMEVFVKSINPELTYGHKGERAAALRLIRSGGLVSTLAAARFAIQVLPDRFAPTCTKPSELERNLPKLRAYKAKLMAQAPGGKDNSIAFVS